MNVLLVTDLVGFFEMILGIMVLAASFVLFVRSQDPVEIFAGGLFSFTMGAWSLGRSRVSYVLDLSALLSIAMLLYVMVKKKEDDSQGRQILKVLISISAVFVAVGLVSHLTQYRAADFNENDSAMTALSFIVILFLISAYFLRLNDVYMVEAGNRALENAAYTDVLTGLRNRAYCDYRFSQYSRYTHSVYTIISLDVNGLKRTNDTLGHVAGDELIRDCADILSVVFEDIGDVIRMGGDEFVVIIDGRRKYQISRALQQMEKMEKSTSENRQYDIRVSYGIASSDRRKRMMPDEVYKAADARMYEMKKAFHMSQES